MTLWEIQKSVKIFLHRRQCETNCMKAQEENLWPLNSPIRAFCPPSASMVGTTGTTFPTPVFSLQREKKERMSNVLTGRGLVEELMYPSTERSELLGWGFQNNNKSLRRICSTKTWHQVERQYCDLLQYQRGCSIFDKTPGDAPKWKPANFFK